MNSRSCPSNLEQQVMHASLYEIVHQLTCTLLSCLIPNSTKMCSLESPNRFPPQRNVFWADTQDLFPIIAEKQEIWPIQMFLPLPPTQNVGRRIHSYSMFTTICDVFRHDVRSTLKNAKSLIFLSIFLFPIFNLMYTSVLLRCFKQNFCGGPRSYGSHYFWLCNLPISIHFWCIKCFFLQVFVYLLIFIF